MREFLTTRRARITPDQVGLPTTGTRRVPGLRRSEVATLAGLSVEYYARLERGQIAGASSGVLDALARALQLDDTERAHLFDLARAADGIPTSGRAARRTAGQGRVTARACSGRWRRSPTASRSSATRTRTCSPPTPSAGRSTRPSSATVAAPRTWPGSSSSTPPPATSTPTGTCSPRCASGIMRAEAGRDPHDRGLQDLVGELSTRSETFRRLWADHNVRTHGAGTKRFHHPVVGELTLAYEELAITAEPGLVLLVYTAEPGSPSAERLRLLASWAAPPSRATSADRSPSTRDQKEPDADHPQLRSTPPRAPATGSPATSTSTPSPPHRRRPG